MVPDTSRPSMSPLADVVPDLKGLATCPLCHTADSRATSLAVSGALTGTVRDAVSGGDALRLETVAAYAVWLAEHTAAPTITHQLIMKADEILVVQEQCV